MSKREVELFIFDIYIAILKIEKTSSKFDNGQDLLYDYLSWDSVIREFAIIGEASKYLLKNEVLKEKHRKVVDFRNLIVHEYFGIDCEEVWDTLKDSLIKYKQVIFEIIKNVEKELKNELIDSFIQDNHYLDFIVEELKRLK